MYTCAICGKECNDIYRLSKHCGRMHKLSSESLFKILNNIQPEQAHLCECGCGQPTKYLDVVNGYRKYRLGHAARINNNWGHNPKAMQNSIEKRRDMIEEGTWKPFFLIETGESWIKGLTADTDERVARMRDTINQPENLIVLSDRMRKMRLDGTIPTLFGPSASQWKGGVSVLNPVIGNNINLYKLWKYPKLCEAGFKCQNCAASKNLEVHHDDETRSEIVKKIATQFNWYELTKGIDLIDINNLELRDLKTKISNAVVDYHVDNKVSGKVLCRKCHKDEHASYNFHDNDIDESDDTGA